MGMPNQALEALNHRDHPEKPTSFGDDEAPFQTPTGASAISI
jgi:hypothetical protein